MCMTVSIEEYRAGWNGFTIEGEYVQPDGSEGLVVKSRYGSYYAIEQVRVLLCDPQCFWVRLQVLREPA